MKSETLGCLILQNKLLHILLSAKQEAQVPRNWIELHVHAYVVATLE